MGFGHTVFTTSDLDAAHRFATEVLGLRQSDWLEMDLAGMPLNVRFYHCNPRHHSLAIGAAPIELPQKLHHVMVETVSQDNVGAAFDRAWNAGLLLRRSLTNTSCVVLMISIACTTTGQREALRDGTMKKRWIAAGMLEAERSFQRVKGHADMPAFVADIARTTTPEAVTPTNHSQVA